MVDKRTRLVSTLALLIIWCATAQVCAARRVFGTLMAMDASGKMTIDTPVGAETILTTQDVNVKRGRVSQTPEVVKVSDMMPGDYLAIVTDPHGLACEISALYGMINGKVSKLDAGRLFLSDGRKVRLRSGAQVIMPDGTSQDITKLRVGTSVTCRVNPISNEAWAVIAGMHGASAAACVTAPPAADKPKAATRPRISSLTYSPSGELQPDDVLNIEMKGTAGGNASFSVMLLAPVTEMHEVSPGYYKAEYRLPADGSVSNAPVVGYLTVGGDKATPVQASKLLTVRKQVVQTANPADAAKSPASAHTPPIVSTPVVSPAAIPATVVTVPVATPDQPERPRELEDIVLKTPWDGAKLKSVILVTGNASPDSKVAVTITYNNGLTGLLKLAGQVATQVLAVGSNGQFRMGPIALEGPLATKGLRFTIKAYYPDRADHGTAVVMAVGDRM